MRARTAITIPAATAIISSAFPLVPRSNHRSQSLWLGLAALAGLGLALAAMADGPTAAAAGTMVTLTAAAAALIRPAIGLSFLAATLPFDLPVGLGPIRIRNSIAILVLLLLIWLGRRLVYGAPRWRHSGLELAVLLFAITSALSLLSMAGHIEVQVRGLLEASAAFLLFFLVIQSINDRADVWLMLAGALMALLLEVCGTLVNALRGGPITELNRASGTLLDPNHLAGALVLGMPAVVALGLALSVRRRWLLIPTGLTTLAFVIALLATLSRSGWLGLLAATLLLIWLLPEQRWTITAIVAMVLVVLTVAGMDEPIRLRLAPHTLGPWETLDSRIQIWQAALAIIVQHPVFGIGIGNFGNHFPQYVGYDFGVDHAHNIFLNVAAERGLPALAAFVLLIGALFKALGLALHRARPTLDRALAATFIAAFAGYLVHSLFDVSYYNPTVLFLFWLFAGIGASLPSLVGTPVAADQAARAAEAPALAL